MGRAFFKPLHHRLISDCRTVTVHAEKRFKALIDSGAAISLAHTSVYNMIEECYKYQHTTCSSTPKTADGSSMSSLGKATLHSQIANFTFSYTFIICDQLSDMDNLFGIDIQKRYSPLNSLEFGFR